MIEVFVPGVPVPQGSKKAFVVGRRAVLVDDNKDRLKPWRAKITRAVEHFDRIEGPVEVRARFVFERPKTVKRHHMSVKPDIDKIARALNDALTDGGLIEDDARVVQLLVAKEYGDVPGVHVSVRSIAE